jgi:hypothetical protein
MKKVIGIILLLFMGVFFKTKLLCMNIDLKNQQSENRRSFEILIEQMENMKDNDENFDSNLNLIKRLLTEDESLMTTCFVAKNEKLLNYFREYYSKALKEIVKFLFLSKSVPVNNDIYFELMQKSLVKFLEKQGEEKIKTMLGCDIELLKKFYEISEKEHNENLCKFTLLLSESIQDKLLSGCSYIRPPDDVFFQNLELIIRQHPTVQYPNLFTSKEFQENQKSNSNNDIRFDLFYREPNHDKIKIEYQRITTAIIQGGEKKEQNKNWRTLNNVNIAMDEYQINQLMEYGAEKISVIPLDLENYNIPIYGCRLYLPNNCEIKALFIDVYGGKTLKDGIDFKDPAKMQSLYDLRPTPLVIECLKNGIAFLSINSSDLYLNDTEQKYVNNEMFNTILISILSCIQTIFEINATRLNGVPFYLFGVSYGAKVIIYFAQKYGTKFNNTNKLGGMIFYNGVFENWNEATFNEYTDLSTNEYTDLSTKEGIEKLEKIPMLFLVSGFDTVIPPTSLIKFYNKFNEKKLLQFFITHSSDLENLRPGSTQVITGHGILFDVYLKYIIPYIKKENVYGKSEINAILENNRINNFFYYTTKKFYSTELREQYKEIFFAEAYKKMINEKIGFYKLQKNDEIIKQLRQMIIRIYLETNFSTDENLLLIIEERKQIIESKFKEVLLQKMVNLGFCLKSINNWINNQSEELLNTSFFVPYLKDILLNAISEVLCNILFESNCCKEMESKFACVISDVISDFFSIFYGSAFKIINYGLRKNFSRKSLLQEAFDKMKCYNNK